MELLLTLLVLTLLLCNPKIKWKLFEIFGLVAVAAALLCFRIEDAVRILWDGVGSMWGSAVDMFCILLFFELYMKTVYFRQMIDVVERWIRKRDMSLYSMTVILGLVVGLCGSPSVIYAVVFSFFRPLYENRNKKVTKLGVLTALAVSVSLAWPWSSKTLLIAGITEVDAVLLWQKAVPMQMLGIAACFVMAVLYQKKEKKEGVILTNAHDVNGMKKEMRQQHEAIFGMIFLVVAVGMLVLGLPSLYLLVLVGGIICLQPLLFKEHKKKVVRNAMTPCLNVIAIGMLISACNQMNGWEGVLSILKDAMSQSGLGIVWLFAWIGCALFLVIPYQCVYVILPVMTKLAVACGHMNWMIALPFVMGYPTVITPSMPSTNLITSFLHQKEWEHQKSAFWPVTIIYGTVLICGYYLVV